MLYQDINLDISLKEFQDINTILAPEILGNRNIKSRIRRFDWLLESLESSVVIGCFVKKLLRAFYYKQIWKSFGKFSATSFV